MDAARRPIEARSTPLIRRMAAALANRSVTPNGISIASIVFALAGSVALLVLPLFWGALLCAAGVQLRLLCNVFDGLVAVEHGKKSAVGALYNEIPDRVADTLFLVALGYAVSLPVVGWCAALFAMATAYIRVLGGALGLAQDFRGPMAKQHRMAVLTLGCVAAMLEGWFASSHIALSVALWVICLGSVLTCVTRLRAIVAQLESNAAKGEAS